jgi:hypothetical protein
LDVYEAVYGTKLKYLMVFIELIDVLQVPALQQPVLANSDFSTMVRLDNKECTHCIF